ncbi:hypothetical protein [Lutispora thermophila]|uniref:Uncharacterized protein n=1 Tax=Lutispora thermophila DSM 19022 TaxID=1122184 RepID=A0A1M6F322_9FIRM|nr:hypothetical protein [Lutispora thermophila]SHI92073.1 hypothetical protein SAMN02745176_01792 [Lutispora thermophila DSM 19022]
MSTYREGYIIRIFLPDKEEEIKMLRNKVIEAYKGLVKQHIRFLSINDDEKKKLYNDIMTSIVKNKEIDEN